jgi:hypothetical protein
MVTARPADAANQDETPASCEHMLCTLLSNHIWPHLSHVSKQRLRHTSRALRAEVDRNISCLEVRSTKHVMGLDSVPWQPKSLMVCAEAGTDMGWLYLKAGSSTGGIRAISQLQALVIHELQFTRAMQQVSKVRNGLPSRVSVCRQWFTHATH